MPKAERLSEKRTAGREANLRGKATEILRTILQPRAIILQNTSKPERDLLFYNLPINFSRRTLGDRSCIFCRFFCASLYGIVNQLFNFSVNGFCKFLFLFWFSMTDLKFSLNASSFLGLSSVHVHT